MTHETRLRPASDAPPGRERLPWPRRSRRGLITVLLTAAVVAFVLVGILAIYSRVQTSIGTQSVQSVLTAAEAALRRAYASQPQYDANLTEVLWSAMPSNAIQGTGANREIVTPWGGEIFAGGGDTPDDDGTGTASNNRFFITVLNLPEAACENLAQGYLNRAEVVGLDVEGAGATAFTQVNTAAQIQAFDSVAEIVTECDGDDDDKFAVVFRG